MKRFIYHFLFLNILLISLFSFSYGMDCSIYDDLISTIEAQINNLKMRAQRESNGHFTEEQVGQVLATSKYADEYNSLKKEYNSAVQQKAQCLNSETSNSSNTTYNNNNYQNNIYTKSQNEICKEEFGSYSRAIGDECECKDGYGWDSPDMNYCVSMEKSCKNRFGDNSIVDGDECKCKDGYGWDSPDMNYCVSIEKSCKNRYGENSIVDGDECKCKNGFIMNETTTKCIADTKEQRELNCKTLRGEHSFYSEENENCICEGGYTRNEDYSKCVKTTIEQKKLNCPAWYGDKSSYSEDEDLCLCSNGYIMNEEKSQCVKETTEQRKLNCASRFDGKAYYSEQENDCICNDGYVYDEEYNACLVALNQKSLESRIMNTKDAKCDDTAVILACALEPTGNDCPAVCLELYDAINWMHDNELTIYNDPTKFGIYNPITREQASKFFVNFYVTAFDKKDKIISIPTPSPFNDIKNADKTLYNFILKSYTLKLFKGTNGKFMPFSHLTKAQALAVMIRMTTGILDESQQPRYSNYLYKAESMDLLNNINYSYTTLDNEDIVRGDVALILYRLYEYLENN